MININKDEGNIKIELEVKEYIGGGGGGDGNIRDYNKLVNKPQINGITLEENKTLEELGIAPLEDCVIIQGTL